MLEKISGTVVSANQKSILISFVGLEVRINANPNSFKIGEEANILTYLSWNADTGPSLFGFATQQERQAFKILIDCPKVGPALAINILSQIDSSQLFRMVCKEDEKGLAKINGVGPKSAKNLISFLKEKSESFLRDHKSEEDIPGEHNLLQDIREALSALGYLGSEISGVVSELGKNTKPSSFDEALRQAFALLQKK